MDTSGARTTLVVLYGGQSAEHDVSCVTAAHVLRAADPAKYRTVAIAIDRNGHWHLPHLPELPSGGADPSAIPARLDAVGTVTSTSAFTALAHTDETVVMPLIHGPLGEDGTVQGLLELINVPYVGSGVLASAVAMDKGVAKNLFAQAGIPQVRYRIVREDSLTPSVFTEIANDLGFPVFVKPANMGSSVGVTKVNSHDELLAAAQVAASYDEWILFEEGVTAREIEVAVIGNRNPRTSVVGEIIPGNDFYDYEDKYVTDSASLMIPALLPDSVASEVRSLAVQAYNALHCEGMARVDFFYEENGRGLLCNEINTIPGFTPISMYPKLWAATGLSYPDLIDELVNHARERHSRRKRNTQH